MKKVVIVGHPTSDYQNVATQLQQLGMAPAAASRREALSPTEITSNLLKAHGIPALDTLTRVDDFAAVNVDQVWNVMALDLLLGNIDKPFWGWADPSAIFFLDYWLSLDSTFKFVFVYNEPRHALLSTLAQAADASFNDMHPFALLDNWSAYNAALLRFHAKNPTRCCLIHSESARREHASLEDIVAFLDLKRDHIRSAQTFQNTSERSPRPLSPHTPAPLAQSVCQSQPQDLRACLDSSWVAATYLAQTIVSMHPEALAVFRSLQATAGSPFNGHQDLPDIYAAWKGLLQQQALLTQAQKRMASTNRPTDAPHLTNRDTEALQKERDALANENKLLLHQLSAFMTDLEYYRSGAPLGYGKSFDPRSKLKYYGAAERVKQQLSYRLGKVMITHAKSFSGWLSMPWALIRETQAFRKYRKRASVEKLPPLRNYQDYQEAERVKRHLAYRLGHALVTNSSSITGWIKMPFALRRAVKQFRIDRDIR
ncbi:hypothetical protein [Caldimonas thermodepolymerans]|uniref:Sulfotransferase family protein n=1 Tax=Caldimonas thermodepolymerans TaxID=215580 RepID=A0AA46HUT2_9BURK|nr:hypothetical protein [Caldimonas thermodepolymerans]TCP04922.1 hypothetical protein EV676_1098 [Caldimonas thermodepolymerans]UZG48298.1 hypothetical protein ONS87_01395 [Caldimonas thermodepolymerans]